MSPGPRANLAKNALFGAVGSVVLRFCRVSLGSFESYKAYWSDSEIAGEPANLGSVLSVRDLPWPVCVTTG